MPEENFRTAQPIKFIISEGGVKYYKTIIDGFIICISNCSGAEEISEAEYTQIIKKLRGLNPQKGYGYKLRADTHEWEIYELPVVEETATGYTEEELTTMTNDELKTILAELGISTTMNKANMVKLILSMQNE